MLVHGAHSEKFRVMHLAGNPRANEVTAEAAARLVADNRATVLEEVPEGIEHHSLLNGRYVPIDAPRNVTATAADKTVVVSWDPVERADSYVLHRRQTGAVPPALVAIAHGVTGTTYTDGDVVNGREYAYVVAGFDCAGQGALSDLESAPRVTPFSAAALAALAAKEKEGV